MATETQTKLSIQPLADRVVIKPSEPESQRPSGIYVAETAKEKPQKGTILAVGPGKWEDGQVEPMTVQPGDTVLFAKYAGTEIRIDDQDVLIMSQKDILATIAS
ncbi:MAG: co-chaperone GroES [Chloroflexota bacterium]|nr:co-chaperone GroES [Chloroflexota bacterium]